MGLAKAVQGSLRPEIFGQLVVVPQQLAELGHNGARGETVDPNVAWSQLSRQSFCQAKQGSLADLFKGRTGKVLLGKKQDRKLDARKYPIETQRRKGPKARDGRHQDNGRPSLHVWDNLTAEQPCRLD